MARTKPLPHADIGAISMLEDPVRARLYAAVRQAGEPVTREDAAAQAGISRKLAAFHLEKLVDAGCSSRKPTSGSRVASAGRRRPTSPCSTR